MISQCFKEICNIDIYDDIEQILNILSVLPVQTYGLGHVLSSCPTAQVKGQLPTLSSNMSWCWPKGCKYHWSSCFDRPDLFRHMVQHITVLSFVAIQVNLILSDFLVEACGEAVQHNWCQVGCFFLRDCCCCLCYFYYCIIYIHSIYI